MRHIAIQFSGGKDSLAALYLSEPVWDRATILHGNTGAMFPHMLAFVRETAERIGVPLVEVHPEVSVIQNIEEFGFPSSLVPIDSTSFKRNFLPNNNGAKIQRCH